MNKKITIIIPVYNMREYLINCLDSIALQTIVDELQIVVVDDGSTDDSMSIILNYKTAMDITIISQSNKGTGKARNIGLRIADGEYVTFLDPDDYYPNRECLAELYSTAVAHNASICGGLILQNAGECISIVYEEKQKKVFADRFIDIQDYDETFFFHRYIYKLSLINENKLCFPGYRRVEDQHFLLDALIASGGFYAANVESYVYRSAYKIINWTISLYLEVLGSYYSLVYKAKQNNLVKMMEGRLGSFNEDHIVPICRYRNNVSVIEWVAKINSLLFEWLGNDTYKIWTKEVEHIVAKAHKEKQMVESILENGKKTVLYGAGSYTARFLNLYGKRGYQIYGIAVTDSVNMKDEMKKIPIRQIDDYSRNDTNIQFVITTSIFVQSKIETYIREKGFGNEIYCVDVKLLELATEMDFE